MQKYYVIAFVLAAFAVAPAFAGDKRHDNDNDNVSLQADDGDKGGASFEYNENGTRMMTDGAGQLHISGNGTDETYIETDHNAGHLTVGGSAVSGSDAGRYDE